jgi:uncharacterized protein (TIGR03083 family)
MGDELEQKEQLRVRIGAARQQLLAAIEQLSDADWDRPTANPEWTARDILTHLSVAETGLLARMQLILDGRSELPPGFDLNVYNNRQVAKKKGAAVGDLVASLEGSRAKVLAFLGALPEDKLSVRGWHASGREVTLAQMFEIMANHESEHAADILTARP